MHKITVNAGRILGAIDRNIFGHFQEHAFGNIYGGVFDPGNPLSDSRGFRTDVLEELKRLNVPMLRYPGGNFVSNYHWEDGIGDPENRRRVFEYAWNTEESNQFGTIEFIELCRELGCEPYICVNMGTGTIEEAMNWVEFCNGTGNTHYANMRRKLGYDEPFRVKYWGLGNEVYGPWQMGRLNAEDYAKKALEFAKAMKWADRTIKLVACGLESDADWNYTAIKTLNFYIDYISAHHYSVGWGAFNPSDYLQLMGIPEYMRQLNEVTKAAINCGCNDSSGRIKIAWDEWNMFGWLVDNVNEDSSYTLTNAIVTASILNFFIRNCDSVKIANYSTFININGAVSVHESGVVKRPQYYAFELIGNNCGGELLDCIVESGYFEAPKPPNLKGGRPQPPHIANEFRIKDDSSFVVPYIDAVASADKEHVYLSVINKHLTDDISVELEINGREFDWEASKMHVLFHEDVNAANTLAAPNEIVPLTVNHSGYGKSFSIPLKKHSLSVIIFKLAD